MRQYERQRDKYMRGMAAVYRQCLEQKVCPLALERGREREREMAPKRQQWQ